ncbi:MAG: dockerin type I repeat-containing protein, partial [Armatimonadetes bacterium]|nr:dockerin type I repeat-containing protein [Armatimonadota bacterium]
GRELNPIHSGMDRYLDHLAPYGEITYVKGRKLYLNGWNQPAAAEIGLFQGVAFHQEGEWQVFYGNTLFRLLTGPQKRGDVNHDGIVNVSDAILTLAAAVQIAPLSPPQFDAADVNRDQSVDASDAVRILRVIVRLDPPFPD